MIEGQQRAQPPRLAGAPTMLPAVTCRVKATLTKLRPLVCGSHYFLEAGAAAWSRHTATRKLDGRAGGVYLDRSGRCRALFRLDSMGGNIPSSESETTRLQHCLDRCNAGDAAARNDLLVAATERLTRLVRKMLRQNPRVRRWEETDDVFQNATLRLARALADVRPPTVRDLLRLAAATIRRELIDLARHYYGPQGAGQHEASPRRGPNEEGLPAALDPGDTTHEPGRLAEWTEFHQHVERLPDEEREVFDLLYYQALPQAEAAALLGVSERTLQRRWREARLRLQEALADPTPSDG